MQQTFQCYKCGAQNYVGQPACWNCKTPFNWQSQQSPYQQQTNWQPQQPYYQQQTGGLRQQYQEGYQGYTGISKSNNKGTWVIASIVLLVVILGGLLYWSSSSGLIDIPIFQSPEGVTRNFFKYMKTAQSDSAYKLLHPNLQSKFINSAAAWQAAFKAMAFADIETGKANIDINATVPTATVPVMVSMPNAFGMIIKQQWSVSLQKVGDTWKISGIDSGSK